MARLVAGTFSTKFDQMTDNMTKEELRKLNEKLNELEDPRLTKIDQSIENLDRQYKECHNYMSTTRIKLNQSQGTLLKWIELIDHLLHTRFFRFLNFFGRWVIYDENDKVYPNIKKYQNLTNSAGVSTDTRGSRSSVSNIRTTSGDIEIKELFSSTNETCKLFVFTPNLNIRQHETSLFNAACSALFEANIAEHEGDRLYITTNELSYTYRFNPDHTCIEWVKDEDSFPDLITLPK